jgi:hypothetical protein
MNKKFANIYTGLTFFTVATLSLFVLLQIINPDILLPCEGRCGMKGQYEDIDSCRIATFGNMFCNFKITSPYKILFYSYNIVLPVILPLLILFLLHKFLKTTKSERIYLIIVNILICLLVLPIVLVNIFGNFLVSILGLPFVIMSLWIIFKK